MRVYLAVAGPVWTFLLLTVVSAGAAWRPARAADFPDAASGSLLLKSARDATAVDGLRVATAIRAQVTGNLARVRVTQEFTNPTDEWMEGLYAFPLPADTAVDELVMHIGERTIHGEIERRETARAAYEQAQRAGRQASLVDQERPNLFKTSVANIGPRSSITVEIAYLETIAYRDGRYTLHVPLAITPRYMPGGSVQSDALPSTPERVTTAAQRVSIDVDLSPGVPLQAVESLHHAVTNSEEGLGRHIRLVGSEVPADRDFELVWTPVVTPDVQVTAFGEQDGRETYAMLMLTPPDIVGQQARKREVIFIIDTSGSMYGPSIAQAQAALQLGIDRLADDDRFNIIRFSNDASGLFAAPRHVDAASRTAAREFIGSLRASGGTEMRVALELAFATQPPPDTLRQIVFITDGSVGNESEIVALIASRVGAARLFTVGIGAAPNDYFLFEAAAAGRGSFTRIADRDQVGARMQDLFLKLERPALLDLALHWPEGVAVDLAAPLPSDLYAGDPLVVLARLSDRPQGLLALTGRGNGGHWVHQMPMTWVAESAGIAKLWARERIAQLARQRHLGADAADLEKRIVDLSLRHHLVSEFTSLVAVDDLPVRPANASGHSEQAPTSAPAGSYWARTTGFTGTATAAPEWLIVGLWALALGGVVHGVRLARRARIS